MTLPGTQIISRDTAPPRSAPTDTGVMFAVGMAEKGKAGATLVTSLSDFSRKFGGRVSYGMLYDAADAFFREGGGKMYVSRVFGPTPVTASVTLDDDEANDTLTVSASSPGEWGNDLTVEIEAGDSGGFIIVVADSDGELERSPSLADKAEAVAWAASSAYIDLTNLASTDNPAVVAATALTLGDDDHTNATDATWLAALDLFTKDLGPGQVTMPGRTTSTAHNDLLTHARDNNRIAVLDAPDTGTASTLRASAAALTSEETARYGGLFAPWLIVPGVVPGTTRTVPPSATVAGIMARNDASGLTPNEPAAGINGISRFAIDTTQTYVDADRESLNDSGVNVIRMMYGQPKVYGYRTLVNPLVDDNWLMLSNARLYMTIAAKADVIAERYVMAQLDGRRRKVAQFGGELTGMLVPYWESGALYGLTVDEAFFVDVGAQVNTDESMANRELRAILSLRMSPFAERVIIEIVKVATTEAVA